MVARSSRYWGRGAGTAGAAGVEEIDVVVPGHQVRVALTRGPGVGRRDGLAVGADDAAHLELAAARVRQAHVHQPGLGRRLQPVHAVAATAALQAQAGLRGMIGDRMVDAVLHRERQLAVGAVYRTRRRIDQVHDARVPTALQHVHETDEVRIDVGVRVLERVSHARLSGQVDHYVKGFAGEQPRHDAEQGRGQRRPQQPTAGLKASEMTLLRPLTDAVGRPRTEPQAIENGQEVSRVEQAAGHQNEDHPRHVRLHRPHAQIPLADEAGDRRRSTGPIRGRLWPLWHARSAVHGGPRTPCPHRVQTR